MIRAVFIVLLAGACLGGAIYWKSHHSAPLSQNTIEVSQTTPQDQFPSTQQSTSQGASTATQNQPGTTATMQTTNAASTGAIIGKAYTQSELLAMAGSVDLTKLPLGDNKYTTSGAKKGYVYVCHVASGGQGAQVNGPWIHGTTWDATTKIAVQGSVPWPNASVKISVSGITRNITSNDLPTNHNTGVFPVQASDPAAQYDRNQSSIVAQNNNYSLPASPSALSNPDCIYGVVGVMTNGVSLNDAFDALYRDAPAHEEQDSCDGHPNNEEGYHYHNLSPCFKAPMVDQVIGWAFDGFPITGPEVSSGKYLTSDDLDECHGLTSTISINGTQVTTYHYVLTYDFPYSISCFRGKSYEPKPGGGSGQQGSTQQGSQTPQQGQGGTPPQAAISACNGKTNGASCSFSAPNGTISGVCNTPPNQSSVACVPN